MARLLRILLNGGLITLPDRGEVTNAIDNARSLRFGSRSSCSFGMEQLAGLMHQVVEIPALGGHDDLAEHPIKLCREQFGLNSLLLRI